ncbi:DNA-binding response regulator [Actinobacteria bacterium YIM 96077]|uniref:DNA-binding response regulator n=1 Tax=Phytoactinopolyspora halophila TaxID=1981511 RepID=A0A329QG78_9ACTN|nr:LytTR family DNA-binding domain-containing protein [Phytoactinopolyspora halophila]AYY12485.1 DNA-binding response regulator [Actinobacteria bacterium YIM 96077]RAW09318.1 DNA-binding response regulator [Phytoactinopolyspora halophila]
MRARCLIVDDEAPAREELRYLLTTFDHVQVVGEATNSEEALTLLRSLTYDVVLLDIRLPGGTGLEVAAALREAPNSPKVIFTTAYPDYAVEAFDLEAIDYLVKPFDAERLGRALDRALSAPVEESEPEVPSQPGRAAGWASDPLGRIPVQQGDRTVLVDESAIVYASAARGYSYLQLSGDRVLVNYSLNELERRVGGHFFRAHRSHLVNLDHVRELIPDFKGSLVLVMNDHRRSRVEVSRRKTRELRRLLGM